jgi:4-hydroxythreonine-4-phosphate dehydrogenase
VIAPAVAELAAAGPGVFSGPHVPDVVFRQAFDGAFDGVVAMYHDQGLIPFKLLEFAHGVNTTLGLPVPRTAPDHGTAFDIAGRGSADPTSMQRAIELAIELA